MKKDSGYNLTAVLIFILILLTNSCRKENRYTYFDFYRFKPMASPTSSTYIDVKYENGRIIKIEYFMHDSILRKDTVIYKYNYKFIEPIYGPTKDSFKYVYAILNDTATIFLFYKKCDSCTQQAIERMTSDSTIKISLLKNKNVTIPFTLFLYDDIRMKHFEKSDFYTDYFTFLFRYSEQNINYKLIENNLPWNVIPPSYSKIKSRYNSLFLDLTEINEQVIIPISMSIGCD